MKSFFAKDAAANEGNSITSFFVLVSKQTRQKRNGEPYVHLALADRTGTLDGKLWQNIGIAAGIQPDDFVKTQGKINQYREQYEIAIERIRPAEESEVAIEDYLPATTKSVDQLWVELAEFIESIDNLELRQLIRDFFLEEETATQFRRAPAAQCLHHAFVGGLLEHVVSLCRLSHLVQQNYPWLNRDLLIAGAILHDIGKIHELSYSRSFHYTDRGLLVGHMAIALEMLHDKIRERPGLSRQLQTLLEHLILSHHGQKEFGSPIEPQFPEAVLLHFLDNADSKLAAMEVALRSCPSEEIWSGRVQALGRRVLQLDTYLPQFSLEPLNQ